MIILNSQVFATCMGLKLLRVLGCTTALLKQVRHMYTMVGEMVIQAGDYSSYSSSQDGQFQEISLRAPIDGYTYVTTILISAMGRKFAAGWQTCHMCHSALFYVISEFLIHRKPINHFMMFFWGIFVFLCRHN